MLFNSIDFALFLPIVFFLYWFVANKNLKSQNLLLVLASYLFYGWWDYRFLALILFSTLVDYIIGVCLLKQENINKRKILLWISIIVNLGFLGFFKYYNFFLDNFKTAFTFFGNELNVDSLNIILPVGISFYTFQTLSYSIDVYKRKLIPTKDFIAFCAFVSFFPQLVAGPIERATNLLPQIIKPRKFESNQAIQGIRLMLWGLFKKIVIADALAPSVNLIFSDYQEYSPLVLIMGAVFFSFQIYCDFSGYSDIARGVSKLFGIELMVNFNFPYFARSSAEFWRKWHISLSTWFRDYLYIPLGGSQVSKFKSIRNVFIIFIVSGFWHGANWTFIVWGLLHALLFIPSFISNTNRIHTDDLPKSNLFFPSFRNSFLIIKTFVLITIAWIFFRAESVEHALLFIKSMFDFNTHNLLFLNPYDNQPLFKEFIYLAGFILIEYLLVTKMISMFSKNRWQGVLIDATLFILIIVNIQISSSLSFIYFQF